MMKRRSFLQKSVLSLAGFGLSAQVRAAAPGANGDIRVAVVGIRGRGQDHISNYLTQKGVRIVALCDVDSAVLAQGKEQLAKKGHDVQTYADLRELLENKDIDAVSIATPNHWHALGAIWSLQAGKDVYVEKPVSHNIWEGRQLVNAAAKSDRIVQMGVQSRSGFGLHQAEAWAKAGNLGKLQYVRGLCNKPRPSIGKVEGAQPVPETVNYDLWCGPAPTAPVTRRQFHYDWHWFWETGNGDLGNQGIHQMDIARRFTGEQALAPSVLAVGGRLGYDDDGQTPNSLFIVQNYVKAPLIFEVRGLPKAKGSKAMDAYRGASVGVIVQYEGGHILCPNYNDAVAFDKAGQETKRFAKAKAAGTPEGDAAAAFDENHYANFLAAVRSRNAKSLRGPIIEGHVSSGLCHTGNISYRLGQKSKPEELREAAKGNPEAMDSLQRLLEHLKVNEVNLDETPLTLGTFLKMDPATERFHGNAEADRMLTREYRAPYVVPTIS